MIQSVEVDGLKAGHKMRQKLKVTGLDAIDGKFVVIQADGDKGDELNNTVVRAFVGGE